MSALQKLVDRCNEMDITEQMNYIGGDVNLAYEAKLELADKDAALEAAKVLVDKMQVVYDTPEYKGVWSLWHTYFGQWKGADWVEEQIALKDALAAIQKVAK
jgi:hypothetical protein